MKDPNSYAEFVLGVFRAQLVDCTRIYPELAKEFDRDLQRLSSAIKCHGIHFTMDVMPSFRKHLDKCLANGRLIPCHLLHFGALGKGVVIPRLFRGLTMRVFDSSGKLKDQPDIVAIRLLRQLLGVVRKMELDTKIANRGEAIREFYRIDQSVRRGSLPWENHDLFSEMVDHNSLSFFDRKVDEPSAELFQREAGSPTTDKHLLFVVQQTADLLTSMLGVFDPAEWKFKHGPGAVSDRRFGAYKYDFKCWPERLESVFPYADFAHANYAHCDMQSTKDARREGFYTEPFAKLHCVPKTLVTPRLIASEPTSFQWCQQSIASYFQRRVKDTLLSLFISFEDQTKNANLALSASIASSHATIDLSSASDRVSCWHVERLFRRSPSLLRALQASRSQVIQQDICKYSPKYHHIRKYSTMGNATTFPVQSLFFLSLALGCVFHRRNLRVNLRNLRMIAKEQVRVFGDDIIVPADCSEVLVALLHDLDLKVNANKTFQTGLFRESCGLDAYAGNDVTCVNIRDMPRRTAPSSIASIVDAQRNMLKAGYFETAAYLRKTVERLGIVKIREVAYGDGAFGWWTYDTPDVSGLKTRFNRMYQRFECLALSASASNSRSLPTGNPGLLQFFTEAASKVTSSVSTIGFLIRRPKSRLTLRWVPIR